mmetsp:Transcript_6173/g.12549  ORF Transcript_6173/g.12549 Transcript_6173/m.12549 type:complete len:681 (-) Transcript_6173:499-2541(-)|eukprot:CAMPEP_0171496442 /NCGR_PEP_ID=MMETSP0958-20121227/6707_1 /TAXON_ID=87120 /ORGANISM="Aurantiochytrium limacinum, Strain ATCCMYA-1381" /LENGTH=680 /DNA_ID=CAMNT_0012030551 /DNA_START=524 /DNA_END=2566 /DNA_ORIENTATION=+
MGCVESVEAHDRKRSTAHALKETKEELKDAKEEIAAKEKKVHQLEAEVGRLRKETLGETPGNILILGCTGMIGKATVKSLVKRDLASEKIRVFAGTRDTSRANDAGLCSFDYVTPVKVNPGHKEEVAKVIIENNVRSVFLIVPGTHDRTEISISAIQGCRLAKVGNIVLLSVLSVKEKVTIFAKQLVPIETAIKESGIPYAILRVPLFTDNCFVHIHSIRDEDKIMGICKPDSPFSTVVTSDVGEAAANLLCTAEPLSGEVYELASDTYTHRDMARIFSEALNKEIQYEQVPPEKSKEALLRMGFPDWQADGIIELYKLIDEGSPSMTHDSVQLQKLMRSEVTTTESFIKAVLPMFVAHKEPAVVEAAKEGSHHSTVDPNAPIMVFNSTSKIGKASVRALHFAGFQVIACMRNVDKAAEAGEDDVEGVEPFALDMGDQAAVAKTVKENKPSAVFIIAPPVEDRAKICQMTIAGLKAAAFRGTVVLMSVINMNLPETSTSMAADFTLIETCLAESNLKHVILRLPFFAENLYIYREKIISDSTFCSPLKPDVEFAVVSTSDVGEAVAKIIAEPSLHAGKTYTLVSDIFKNAKVVEELSENLEREIKYKQVSYDEARDIWTHHGFSVWLVNEFIENFTIINEEGKDQQLMATRHEDLQDIIGRVPTSLSIFIALAAPNFRAD